MASASAQRMAAVMANEMLANANNQNRQILDQGYGRAEDMLVDRTNSALGSLGQGYDAARGEYARAQAMYNPYAQAGLTALGEYGNSIGLNGQAGYDAAKAAFRASPGYQYTVDQATDQVARKASALGALGSGNTMTAIQDRAANLADQEYNGYQNRLQGMTQLGYQATGAQAGLQKGIGDLYASQGTGSAALYASEGQNLANVETGHANQVANSNLTAAGAMGQNANSAGQATDAARNANSNLLLGLGAGLLGMKTGQNSTVGGSIFSGLGSLLGGL